MPALSGAYTYPGRQVPRLPVLLRLALPCRPGCFLGLRHHLLEKNQRTNHLSFWGRHRKSFSTRSIAGTAWHNRSPLIVAIEDFPCLVCFV